MEQRHEGTLALVYAPHAPPGHLKIPVDAPRGWSMGVTARLSWTKPRSPRPRAAYCAWICLVSWRLNALLQLVWVGLLATWAGEGREALPADDERQTPRLAASHWSRASMHRFPLSDVQSQALLQDEDLHWRIMKQCLGQKVSPIQSMGSWTAIPESPGA